MSVPYRPKRETEDSGDGIDLDSYGMRLLPDETVVALFEVDFGWWNWLHNKADALVLTNQRLIHVEKAEQARAARAAHLSDVAYLDISQVKAGCLSWSSPTGITTTIGNEDILIRVDDRRLDVAQDFVAAFFQRKQELAERRRVDN